MAAGERREVLWHALPVEEVLRLLAASEAGLTGAEAGARLARCGTNRLPSAPAPGRWTILLRQFQSPLIYILAIAAFVAFLAHPDDPADALFIVAVLLVNAGIGFFQEWRAECSSRALQQLLTVRASVARDGELREIAAEQVVPGDIVWLESGNRVPADIRLLFAHGLEVDESLLTGESLPVTKEQGWLGEESTPLSDRLNMVYAGSTVVRGRARGVVAATGRETAVGLLARDVLTASGGRPPLLVRMERFSRVVAGGVLLAALVIAGIGVVWRGHTIGEMFLFGVALAVSAIPEGLPVALTVALAIATTRMARRGVIVRRLAAVEGLGSCTFIGSDKTGTLTCNELTVKAIRLADGSAFRVSGEGFSPAGEILRDGRAIVAGDNPQLGHLGLAAVLCNEAELVQTEAGWRWRGDPTDVALLVLGRKLELVRETLQGSFPQFNEIAFEPERRYAATYHRSAGEPICCVKGAPERVLPMCREPRGSTALTRLAGYAAEMAEQGFRVLALAWGKAPADLDAARAPMEPDGLTFLGFVGMIDPLRPGVRDAVAACRQAGVVVCMITGDHPATALAIARDLGLAEERGQVAGGSELEAMSETQLDDAVARIRVFARTTPRQKLQLVEAAQRLGHYVAVTGDGVNDAPALRQANIGVAMGRSGTDVARETAELVLADDNFASIVGGIEEGRIAYENVRKVIYLLVSTGAAEVVLLGLAVGTGLPATETGFAVLPLLPVQLLWLNLVTNGIQDMALAFDPGEQGVLERRPRPPGERIFNSLMLQRTVIAALVIGVVAFSAFCWMIDVAGWAEERARNALLLLMVLFENIHIQNCRSETVSAFRLSLFSCPILLIGTLLAFSIHMASMRIPFMQRILGLAPVDLATFLILVLLALTVIGALEIHKIWLRSRGAAGPAQPAPAD